MEGTEATPETNGWVDDPNGDDDETFPPHLNEDLESDPIEDDEDDE